MYAFKDKGDRDICLIPEATAIIQQQYRESWSKSLPKPLRLFYVQRCYRYERPQEGRYREFFQFGIEMLGGQKLPDKTEVIELLVKSLENLNLKNYQVDIGVKRGLSYYVEDGFEIKCPELGAQQQIAGGGRYAEGIGWAIGLDRLVLALEKQSK